MLRSALCLASMPGTILFPPRLVSRHLRPDDSDEENQYLDPAEFDPRFRSGALDFYWSKLFKLRSRGTEHYGFEPCRAAEVVYGCNNAFVLNRSSLHSHSDLLSDSLVVLVTCSTEERTRRLDARYSTVSVPRAELNDRLLDTDKAVRDASDVIVNGETRDIPAAALEVLRLARLGGRT